jgi:hypothetical protein
LRVLAVELARRDELEVAAVAYDDDSLELEVVLAAHRFCEPVTISRDRRGDRCRVILEWWTDVQDDARIESAVDIVAALAVTGSTAL